MGTHDLLRTFSTHDRLEKLELVFSKLKLVGINLDLQASDGPPMMKRCHICRTEGTPILQHSVLQKYEQGLSPVLNLLIE
jgi:hypothetical protein